MGKYPLRQRPTPGPGERSAWMAWFVFANGILAALVGTRFLTWMEIPDAGVAAYLGLLYLGQFPLLAWLAGVGLVLAAALTRRPLLTWIAVLVATAGQALLLLDTVVYNQYRFHLSSFVLELLLGAGSEVFSFSWLTWALTLSALASLLAVQYALAQLLWRHRPRARLLWTALGLLVVTQLGAHGWHAWADAHYDTRITGLSRHVPLYYGATAKRFFEKHGLVDAAAARRNSELESLHRIGARAGAARYPADPLACTPPERPLNVLVVVIDSLRADMLDPRWMPNVSAFAERSTVFRNHYSNGNATKPGIFSLFYGVPASYWDVFTAQGTPPALMQRMRELDYRMAILASATLVSPAFDRNVFAGVPDLRLHTPGAVAWQRDERITDDWLRFTNALRQHERREPFFGFLFYDTVHSTQIPEDFPRLEPYWDVVNELGLGPEFDPEPYFNVYKTAVRYTDTLVQRVLADLEAKRLLDHTIVVITSDHGEEFNDNGRNYWGHGSNFSDVQLKVPMVVRWPGKPPATLDHRTEHFDLAPTLLRRALGCAAVAPETLASGDDLFEPSQRNWSVAHSYMNYALLLDELRIVTRPGGIDAVRTDMTPVPNPDVSPRVLAEFLNELSRFYKK